MSNGGATEKNSSLFKAGLLSAVFGAVAFVGFVPLSLKTSSFDQDHPEAAAARAKIAQSQPLGQTEILTLKIANIEKEELLIANGVDLGAGLAFLLTGLGCILADEKNRKKKQTAPVA